MRIAAKAAVLLCGGVLALSACRREEGPAERAGKEVDKAMQESAQKMGEAMQKAGEQMGQAGKQMGQALEDAARQARQTPPP
jgi:hypothetical protein